MYSSPIEVICGELQTQTEQEDEKMVMKATRQVGVNVDKEELIKALQYDRNQYAEGYEDGKNDVLEKMRAEIDVETRVQVRHYTNTNAVIDAVLDVIDKYKAESEVKE